MPWRPSCSQGVDLFFRGKLEALLDGHHLVTTDSVDLPDLVIVDIARVEPDEVVDSWPDVPIVGFTNHTDKSGLQRAHTAGFDQVLVKSARGAGSGDRGRADRAVPLTSLARTRSAVTYIIAEPCASTSSTAPASTFAWSTASTSSTPGC